MYCPAHDRYFEPHQGCFACTEENIASWEHKDEPTAEEKEIEHLSVEIEHLNVNLARAKDKEKKLSLLTDTLSASLREVSLELQKTENLLNMEKTKSEHIGVAYQRSLGTEEELREQLTKCKGKLGSTQREHDDCCEHSQLLFSLLARHFNLCNSGVEIVPYKHTMLYEHTKSVLNPMKKPRKVRSPDLTGFVPGGMIETHAADCRIWPSSCAAEKVCTCRDCPKCGKNPCECKHLRCGAHP